jgi:hypothetical protein
MWVSWVCTRARMTHQTKNHAHELSVIAQCCYTLAVVPGGWHPLTNTRAYTHTSINQPRGYSRMNGPRTIGLVAVHTHTHVAGVYKFKPTRVTRQALLTLGAWASQHETTDHIANTTPTGWTLPIVQ